MRLARASSKRGRGPRTHARSTVKAGSQPTAATPPKKRRSSSAEDLMFFPRLRRRAKWVFVFLAVIFAGGFLVFGVGTGVQGTSLGDILQNVFHSGSSNQPSVKDAQKKLAKNPNDAAAQLELANALVANQRIDEAIAALTRYTELKPKDVEGRVQLAGLYDRQATVARQAVVDLQSQSQAETPGQAFRPSSTSPLGAALGQDPIEQALSQRSTADLTSALSKMRVSYRKAEGAYEQLTLLVPEEPAYFLRLGFAAQNANDTDSAIAAYEQFLKLSPDDSSAPLVKAQLGVLKGTTSQPTATSSGSSSASTGSGG
jgi:predicted Zn-dependent protease